MLFYHSREDLHLTSFVVWTGASKLAWALRSSSLGKGPYDEDSRAMRYAGVRVAVVSAPSSTCDYLQN